MSKLDIAVESFADRETPSSVASVAYVAGWPTLDPAALQGIPGEFVRLVEPHSEADRAALLVQFLIAVGNLIGRGPYFEVEAARHGLNLFGVMVGDTSKGRKGTSWNHVKRVLRLVEPDWLPRVKGGISSGEGIVCEVRDPSYKLGSEGEQVLTDEGQADKRLLLVEPEFASVLKVATRQGNTVSTVIRDAWDQDLLSPLTKNARIAATRPHISIIGHVSREELLRHLTETDAASGFGNRFLWVCCRRSKLLPRGGRLHEENLQPLTDRIREAVVAARNLGSVERTEETWEDWERVYGPLSRGKPGLFGAMVGRAEAQVTRLSTLYAVLDRSAVILPRHQAAALALWEYCEQSTKYIFGDSLGDPTADRIRRELRESAAGLTRTEIRDLFKRHKNASDIERALDALERQGLARCWPVTTKGRSVEKWVATCDISDESDQSVRP